MNSQLPRLKKFSLHFSISQNRRVFVPPFGRGFTICVWFISMVGRSQMPTNHNTPATASTSSRAAKRKAESSPTQEEPATTGSQSRPQRKKQKQQQQPSSTSPSASPVATATATTTIKGNESALTKHLLGLLDEIKNAVDDEYVSLPPL